MYKVIHNNLVIDILDTLQYAKYMKKSKRTYMCDRSSANCIMSSDRRDRYHISGLPVPEGGSYKEVSIVRIDDIEALKLISELGDDDSVSDCVRFARKIKIDELRNTCNMRILNGVSVILADGEYHHFSMSIEDQLNLIEAEYLLKMGESSVLYHENGGKYIEYSPDDMMKIISACRDHKTKNLLHFNELKGKINSMDDIDHINKMTYGI